MRCCAAVLGCGGPALSRDEALFFGDAQPLGFILFARNIESPDQVRRLTGDLRAAVGRDAPVLVDQEGGRVQRLRAPHWREFLPPLDQMARSGRAFRRALWLRFRLIADDLRSVGIDVNCAPCGDIAGPDTHPFLRNRCLGQDAATVIEAARAVAEALLAGGVLPVIKHMPGHGRATVDSHHSCPRVTVPLADLQTTDFAVFRALADLTAGMTGHIIFDAIDPDRPATASPGVVRAIREDIGFGGLLLTDDLSMQALAGDVAARAAAAIAAGCDVVLHCNGRMPEMMQAAAAAGALSPLGAMRADRALVQRHVPAKTDLRAAEAELAALLADAADA